MDIQTIIYGARLQRRPWTQPIEIEIDAFEGRVVNRGSGDYSHHPKLTRLIVFSGRTAVGGCETEVFGRLHKTHYGWAALPDLELDKPDVPALKALTGEIPLAGDVPYRRTPYLSTTYLPITTERDRQSVGRYDHLYGTKEAVLANLRKTHQTAGEPYVTPTGTQSH